MKTLLLASAALSLVFAQAASAQVAVSDFNSTANSGSVSGSISHGGASTSGSSAVTGASTANAAQSADNAGNAQSITFNSTASDRLKTVPQVYAPALSTTLTETCMGSTSGGISVMGIGGTLGTTWNDTQCVRRLNAREMAQTFGDREAARALLCQDADVAAAYEAVGQDCRSPYAPVAYVPPVPPAPQPYAAPVTAPQAVPPVPGVMAPIPNPATTAGERG